MNLTLRQSAEIERIKSEIADQYGVTDFEDIDRGKVTSRAIIFNFRLPPAGKRKLNIIA